MARIAALPHLRSPGMCGVAGITANGLRLLKTRPSLRRLVLSSRDIPAALIAELQEALPQCDIIAQ